MSTLKEHWLVPQEPFESYDAYRAATGSSAVNKAREMEPAAVIQELQRSGLRGRGGAGFPAGTKWRSIATHDAETKYVVCNAAEGEPGTFKDRWLLRQNPYALLEGMLIAVHAVGAVPKVYIGIKESFAEERERLRAAIDEVGQSGVCAGIEFRIVAGPDEYLYGEEKALLEVISGAGPFPREAHLPPYEYGLFATPAAPNPTVVNNVQTFSHVPSIVRAGAASFRALGTEGTPGTILFTVSGDVRRPGVYECEAGITLREVFEKHAGGPLEGRSFKAALSGVAAGVIPESRFDTPADFDSLQLVGSGLGSAGFIVIDDARSVPRVAQSVARFLYVESCNQCSACKHGLRDASRHLDALMESDTPDGALDRALFGARRAPQGNRCFLPVQASKLLPSLVKQYGDEFDKLAGAAAADAAPFPIPKMIGFDSKEHRFELDERQSRKRPDWTYAPPSEEPVEPVHRPAERPHDASSTPVVVHLAPDVAEAFTVFLDRPDVTLDEQVNHALRDWLRHQKP